MLKLYIAKDSDDNSRLYVCNISEDQTKIVVNLLKLGYNVEIRSSGCPLINYRDNFIETDEDGFAGITDFTLDNS